MTFSFRELLDTANTWKDIANDRNLISVYKLKSKVSCQCPLECPRGFQVNDRSLSHIGHAIHYALFCFEMFTGYVINIFFRHILRLKEKSCC